MKMFFQLIFVAQVAAYLILGWLHFISGQNTQIPAAYIALHFVAALNFLFLILAIWAFFTQRAGSWSRMIVLWLSIPPIFGVATLYAIKMTHRWL